MYQKQDNRHVSFCLALFPKYYTELHIECFVIADTYYMCVCVLLFVMEKVALKCILALE